VKQSLQAIVVHDLQGGEYEGQQMFAADGCTSLCELAADEHGWASRVQELDQDLRIEQQKETSLNNFERICAAEAWKATADVHDGPFMM
jgi:hypothetical protein